MTVIFRGVLYADADMSECMLALAMLRRDDGKAVRDGVKVLVDDRCDVGSDQLRLGQADPAGVNDCWNEIPPRPSLPESSM